MIKAKAYVKDSNDAVAEWEFSKLHLLLKFIGERAGDGFIVDETCQTVWPWHAVEFIRYEETETK